MSEEPRELNLTERMIPMKGGKHYLQVADRIVWFREEYPEGTIETTLVELDRAQAFCMFRARVTTGKGGVAEATGTETAKDFGDYIEKSETKAVGRALGYLGFGTASAGFEEGQRVVDAPRDVRSAPARSQAARPAPPAAAPPPLPASVPQYRAEEYDELVDKAWAMAEDQCPLADIKDYFNKHRHRMTKAQMDETRVAIEKIAADHYAPASIAG